MNPFRPFAPILYPITRETLERDFEEFKRKGGKVEKLEPGARAQPLLPYTKRRGVAFGNQKKRKKTEAKDEEE